MTCLCCGKVLRDGSSVSGWHKSCIKKFFGTTSIPKIEIDDQALELLAMEYTHSGITVPGVQKKISLHRDSIIASPRCQLI